MDRGDIFVFEHPLRPKSWNDVCMQRLLKNDQVHRVAADQCMFGLKNRISKKRHRKSTDIMTNSKHVAQEMELKCSQDRRTMGASFKAGSRVPPTICQGSFKGFSERHA